jgi:hypothetical protein
MRFLELCQKILKGLFTPALPSRITSLAPFTFPQPDKPRMPQVTIRRPFGELYLCGQLRPKRHTVFHFFLSQRRTAVSVRSGRNFLAATLFNDKKLASAVVVRDRGRPEGLLRI